MDPDPRGPKTCGSGSGFESGTLLYISFFKKQNKLTILQIYFCHKVCYLRNHAHSHGEKKAVLLQRACKRNVICTNRTQRMKDRERGLSWFSMTQRMKDRERGLIIYHNTGNER
jgi:hypothetical protein